MSSRDRNLETVITHAQTRQGLLNALLLGVAAHSVVAGAALLVFPLATLGLVRWEYTGPAFWPSQAGLFLILLGIAYAAAVWVRPLIWLVVGSKASAFVFLTVSAGWGYAPRVAAWLGCGDGLMGLAVALALWRLRANRR